MPTKAAIVKLKNDLIAMGEMCEHSLSTAVMALIDRNEEMAESVIVYDDEVDYMEIEVDSQCAKLIAKGGLDGAQLRFVCATMKISSELEHISDCAVEICEHVLFLVRQRSVLSEVIDFVSLVEQVSQMMRESVRALVEHDPDLARKILDEQIVVKDEMGLVFGEIMEIMYKTPPCIERACHILALCKTLENIGQMAANVAGHVIFLEEGHKVPRQERRTMQPMPTKMTHLENGSGGKITEEEKRLVDHHSRRMKKRMTSIIKKHQTA